MSAAQTFAPAVQHDHAGHWKYLWKKRIVIWARWLHIYLSMISFGILFFFAATGLMLNHQNWFAQQQRTADYKGNLNSAWVGKDVDKLDIVEHLRQAHGIKAAVSDFRVEDNQIAVSFKGPGYEADAFVDRPSGSYEVNETRMGWAAVINDLHKGRDAGPVWGKLIDASAVFLSLVSFTGLTLIFFLSKRRRSGLILLAVGALACAAMYLAFTP